MYLSKEGHLSKRHHRSHRADNAARSFKSNNFKENIIDINSYRKPIKQTVVLLPKNKAQEKYIDSLENPNINIVFGYGYKGCFIFFNNSFLLYCFFVFTEVAFFRL